MSVNASQQKDLQDRLIEMAKAGQAGYAEWYKGATLGLGQPNDAQFLMWFVAHNQPTTAAGQPNPQYDPDWVRCLQYVAGGNDELRRAMRIIAPPPPKPTPREQALSAIHFDPSAEVQP